MAKTTSAAADTINTYFRRLKNFLDFTRVFLKKRNPIKIFFNEIIGQIKELATIKKKLKNIQYRINYEKYKLKKTELILAQNSEHVFLKGRSLNQTR